MITANQLVAHLVGDYVLQSDWMATEKTKRSIAAFVHAFVYSLCFLALRPSAAALFVIFFTHFLIDRFRLARYVCWSKNFLAPPETTAFENHVGGQRLTTTVWWHPWSECSATGYHKDRPPWLAVWLLIIADNTLHILINGLALYFL